MSVRKTTRYGKPFWVVEVRRVGFRTRRYLARPEHKKRDAEALERQLLAEAEASRTGGQEAQEGTISATELMLRTQAVERPRGAERPNRSSMSFAEFAVTYLELQDPGRSDFVNKRRNINLHLRPFFGSRKLSEIGRMQIDRFRAKLRQPGPRGARSVKTINNVLATLRTMLNVAHEYGYLDNAPRIVGERCRRADPVFLDFEEAAAFIAAADQPWRLLFQFAIATGLRRGELMELRWRDLDLSASTVRVARAARKHNGVWEVKSTKGNRPRTVPLGKDIVPELGAARGKARIDELVFPPTDGRGHGVGGAYFCDRRFYRAAVRTGQKARLSKHIRPHVLRHTFASHCSMEGVPPRLIQQWMGHESFQTTERYAHLRPDMLGASYGERLAERRAKTARPLNDHYNDH